MNILIIEDEKIAADNLAVLLKSIEPNIHIMAQIESVRDAINWLTYNNADLIFCDIQLSDGISFTIFEKTTINTPIIFTTAYDQYAIRAFKVNSIDYLLKPIDQQELKNAINKYKSLQSHKGIDIQALISTLNNKTQYQERFMVYAGQKIKTIKTSEIAYHFIANGNVFAKTTDGMTYDLDYTLDKLEEILNPKFFFRINRQMIINIEAISSMYSASKSRIKLELKPSFNEDVFVSFNNMQNFKQWLNK